MRQAGTGLAEGTGGRGMRTKHEIGMPTKPVVHADRSLVAVAGTNLVRVKPGDIASGLTGLALPEEEDVDDNVGAGIRPEAAFGQADGGDEMGASDDMLVHWRFRLVHRP